MELLCARPPFCLPSAQEPWAFYRRADRDRVDTHWESGTSGKRSTACRIQILTEGIRSEWGGCKTAGTGRTASLLCLFLRTTGGKYLCFAPPPRPQRIKQVKGSEIGFLAVMRRFLRSGTKINLQRSPAFICCPHSGGVLFLTAVLMAVRMKLLFLTVRAK